MTSRVTMPEPRGAIQTIRSTDTIRARCGELYQLGLEGKLEHFSVDEARLPEVAQLVADVTRVAYPSLEVPYHCRENHFRAGGVVREIPIDSTAERGRTMIDLIVTSVLLDAGAGPDWSYRENGASYARSEGLAVASFHMFREGAFSNDGKTPRADGEALTKVTPDVIAKGFQVSAENPLVGLEGRAGLLRRLGEAVMAEPAIFHGRVGGLFDWLIARGERVSARDVLGTVLRTLSPIWPGRIEVLGVNVGDVWRHPKAGGADPIAHLVPFHKLSQWLTYSILPVLERHGFVVTDVDALTGLAEYRNGGLFVDGGVITPKHDAVLRDAHLPSSEIVVEWRALTVALLDRIAPMVRRELGVTQQDFPLAKVLEGGTWAAGRAIAARKRAGGGPPIRIDSDGTVF